MIPPGKSLHPTARVPKLRIITLGDENEDFHGPMVINHWVPNWDDLF